MITLDRRCTDTVVSFWVTVPVYNDHTGQTLHWYCSGLAGHCAWLQWSRWTDITLNFCRHSTPLTFFFLPLNSKAAWANLLKKHFCDTKGDATIFTPLPSPLSASCCCHWLRWHHHLLSLQLCLLKLHLLPLPWLPLLKMMVLLQFSNTAVWNEPSLSPAYVTH